MSRINVSSGSPYERPIGFSRAVRVGTSIYVSGTAPIGLDGKPVAPGDVGAQARRCFDIIEAALAEAGVTLRKVVRTRTYLVNADDWEIVGRIHGEFFGEIRPASTMVVVSKLLEPEWLVEIEADAVADAVADSVVEPATRPVARGE